MNEKLQNQVAEMKKQTIGVEVEMNSITRHAAAKVAAEFFGTHRCEDTAHRNGEMQRWIDIDMELGCGFAPAGAYDGMYQEIGRLEEELARLQHYASVEEMYYDTRGCENPGYPY